MIGKSIEALQYADHYGAGECTEIAKGKHELVTKWSDVKRKIKRKRWHLKKR